MLGSGSIRKKDAGIQNVDESGGVENAMGDDGRPDAARVFVQQHQYGSEDCQGDERNQADVDDAEEEGGGDQGKPDARVFFHDRVQITAENKFLHQRGGDGGAEADNRDQGNVAGVPQHGNNGLFGRGVGGVFNPLEQARLVQQEVDGQHQQITCRRSVEEDFQGMFFQSQRLHPARMEHAHQQDEGQNEIQAGSVENLVAVQLHVGCAGRSGSPRRRGCRQQGPQAEVKHNDAAHGDVQHVQMAYGNTPFQRMPGIRRMIPAEYVYRHGEEHDGNQDGREQGNELVR